MLKDVEEVLLKNLEHERYHSGRKDCNLVDKSVQEKYTKSSKIHIVLRQSLCKTHKVLVGPSGWEWGYYGGFKTSDL